ncbi:TadE family protein [Myceligenerans pegani]|uniref:TadE family protein n=1 Tax=Myceligenerans pegani TaxID=2776917 RepID=UPI00299EF517|nr:TadE/TadG family type IV pilus assembly protein [Myceligenerans sp. TRM 65318]
MPAGPDAERERGAASIQTVITYPVVLLLIFGIVQGVIYFHAQNVARSVANGAVQAARLENGTIADGYAEAAARLDRGRDVFASVEVFVDRDEEVATATVEGLAPSLVPGFRGLRVEQTATGPVERFTPAVGP